MCILTVICPAICCRVMTAEKRFFSLQIHIMEVSMKKFVKNTLSCALAMLCTANAVPFASVAVADPAALNMASAFVAS